MQRNLFSLFVCSLIIILGKTSPTSAADRPNILIVLADDLGYSDLGCYGGEIETPHLDQLAAGGLRFTQFYNTGRCWPTRSSLLTGFYAQQVRRDKLPGIPSGARGKRPAWARLVPETLQSLGYRTYHSGKWHIDGMPLKNGFDRSYYLQDQGRFFNPKVHYEDDNKLPPVKPGTGFYGTVAIADHAVRCLQDHADRHADQPFFHYLAFTAPHFPLHALPEDIERYREVYRRDWEHVRAERWQRIKDAGMIRGRLSAVERTVGPPYDFPEALEKLGESEVNRPLAWDSLSPEQQEFQASKMAIHAAMIDRLDRELGRVLEQIKSMGAWENTLIMFLSDNGASAEIMVRDDGHDPDAALGSAATYLCLGPGWSTTSNTPFRRHKTWVHEGGIATPFIVHWPEKIADQGEWRHGPGHVIDIVPTLFEILQVAGHGAGSDDQPPERPGQSLLSELTGNDQRQRGDLWWSHEGNRAYRSGNMKLVAAGQDAAWELYDLSVDRTETKDLVEQMPDRAIEMAQAWRQRQDEFIELASRDLNESGEQPPKRRQEKPRTKPVKSLILPGESFLLAERPAFILKPKQGLLEENQPWIMYAPTLAPYPDSHEKRMHQQFLDAGIAVVGIDVGESYGSPEGRRLFDKLYDELVSKRGFATKGCLLGRSRGGLWVTSWASENPEKVSGIAGIYPVFDLRSYPGLERAAPAYKMTAEQLEQQLTEFNPIESVNALAKARIPIFIIHGNADVVVPLEQNSAELSKRYADAGAGDLVELVIAKGQGHNYWEGFFQCQPLIDFAIERAKSSAAK